MLAQEIIRRKRDGHALGRLEIEAFVRGLADGGWSDAQAGALAMAIVLRGMDRAETVALTEAMTRSGEVLDWSPLGLPGPVLDKHSTGGVGDKVSLALAPLVAACGGFVPMISGRGLGHTGGTLDKLESIPGYAVRASPELVQRTLKDVGCAIVSATRTLAPADARLYAIRDVTDTVESLPLICASILSKKLAAGLQGLVMDVKVGSGAFAPTLAKARELAQALVEVASGAGLPTRAWITDMNEVLGTTAGNALEVREAVNFLRGEETDSRFAEVTKTLCAELLQLGELAVDADAAKARVDRALADGSAAERFGRMVAALGGPADFVERCEAYLPVAPVQQDVLAPRAGFVSRIDVRAIGLAVIELGGGRRIATDVPDLRVGYASVAGLGLRVDRGDVLARVHAADDSAAQAAGERLLAALAIGDVAPLGTGVLVERILPSGQLATPMIQGTNS